MAGNIYHSWNGTVLTITSDSGSSSCDLKGATGDTGIRGPQGPKGEKGNGIDSVNGKIGDVVLTYEDVGALPDTYIPPVTKVNSKTGEVTLTYEDIGALPNTYVAPVTSVNTKTGAVQLTYSDVGAAAANHTHTAEDVGAATAEEVSALKDDKLDKTGTAADSSKLGGKAPEYYIQPRNLLDNSDFRNPVNQREQNSYSLGNWGGYTIDRWATYANGVDLALTENGISFSKCIYQKISKDTVAMYNGKNLTFSAKIGDIVYICSGVITQTGSWHIAAECINGSSKIRMEVENTNDMMFIIENSSAATVEWAALYEGSYTAETLPPYVPKGYAAELAECRRYYKRFTSPNAAIICAGYVTGSTKCIYFNAPDNQPMRIVKPSCTFTGLITVRGINGYIAEDYSGGVFTVYANVTGCISMIEITRGDSAAWNATNNTPVFVNFHGDSVFELIADL